MLEFHNLLWAQILIVAFALAAAFLGDQGRRSLLLLLGAVPFGLCVAWSQLDLHSPRTLRDRFVMVFENAPEAFALCSLAIGGWLIWKFRGFRLFAALFATLSFAVALLLSLLLKMQVTGDWL